MNSYLVRALLAVALAAFLWVQSRGLAARPRRRRAFELGAAAMLALAALNGGLALGLASSALQLALGAVAIGLFVGAVISLLASLRAGEAADQREQIAAAAREYRERREQQRRHPK